jgi:hypothetical protein
VVNFTFQLFSSRGKNPRDPLDKRLSEPQGRSGHEEVKILVLTGTRNSRLLVDTVVLKREISAPARYSTLINRKGYLS